jgi:hypothetical protein
MHFTRGGNGGPEGKGFTPNRKDSRAVDDQTVRALTVTCAVWGACVSTLLGLVKLWETFWKDRLRLSTTYYFGSRDGTANEITIVNLSGVPVQVSHWTLAWKPNRFRWRTPAIDVTRDEGTPMFTIAPKDNHTLCFEESDYFDWSYRTARNRALFLTLHIFGRRRPKVLRVGGGQ